MKYLIFGSGEMSSISLKMALQNECSNITKILLEPLSEYFLIPPGKYIEVHAIFDDLTNNMMFTVAPNDELLTVYAPGEISGFIDFYVTCDGIRLIPDGN